jgi:hypothetical protein
MTNKMLQEIACPNCRTPIDVREHGQHVYCDACGSQFLLQGHLCPQCETYHDDEAIICGQCGYGLKRACRKCRTVNWAGDEYCASCGTAMDILDLLNQQYKGATADRLHHQMEMARELKEIEDRDSQKRRAEMKAIEAERQAEFAARLKKQRKDERLLLMLTFGAVSLFVLILLIYVLITNLG